MGNTTNSNSAPTSPSRWSLRRQHSTMKQIHITTDHPDGFYFTGDRLTGTVRIPTSFVHHHLHNINNQTPSELLYKRSLRSAIIIELVGDAIYSAEVDVAADSDGHSTHKVNLCRHRCIVTLNKPDPQQSSDTNSLPITPPSELNGTFQLNIPDNLPPSLPNSRTPIVVYTLELSLSSSRYRYQVPITLSSKGCIPYPMTDIEINGSTISKNDIHLCAYLSQSFYRPGEQIPIRINYSNPQQRFIRSIKIRLMQIYRIHNDQNRLQLDGKEWIFDVLTISPQREWTGEARLQLPNQPLQASYSLNSVGTTQAIQCELDYRIQIELTEKKGDEIHLTLSSIQITYQQ
jgi:hypothetical protein